ncbi:hypothetical protein SE17_27770, partial [Kouleothrix aurantiaca]
MAPSQTLFFTIMPRGTSLDADPLPVSVLVSPRLVGETRLGAFADWLGWTRLLAERGLQLRVDCGAQSMTLAINPAPLRPELWEALFNAETLVRSHEFDDYSGGGVHSYPFRKGLALIKDLYQQIGVELALPDRAPVKREGGARARSTLR